MDTSRHNTTAAGRPPVYLGELTVTKLTVQHGDRPEKICLTAEPSGLAIAIHDSEDRVVAALQAHPDGSSSIELAAPGGARISLLIDLNGVPLLRSQPANCAPRVEVLPGRFPVENDR